MLQLHQGALYVGIYKWAQSDQNDKTANSISVLEADLLSVYVPYIDRYTFFSILLATFNYRVRGTCVPARTFTHELLVKQV